MPAVALQQLLEAGTHFGHQTKRWNPKMKRFILCARNGIYIVDLNKTIQCLDSFLARVRSEVSKGGKVLFVGTKEQIRDCVREEATLGARTTLDVLNAEQELLNARASLISAQVDETIASYSLLASMGLMTAQALNLRVQIYDPAAYYNLVDDAPAIRSEQGQALDRVLRSIGGN